MNTSTEATLQGHRLIQAGVLLFLFALIVGLLIPRFSVPRLGLSVHLLGILQGIFLMITGTVWPRLRLVRATLRLGFWLTLYGCISAWMANLLAGVWKAGASMLPMAAGTARGSELEEWIIALGLRSAALSLILAAVLILWGLRGAASDGADARSTD